MHSYISSNYSFNIKYPYMNYTYSPFNGLEVYSMTEYSIGYQSVKLKHVRWMHQLFDKGIMYSFYLN